VSRLSKKWRCNANNHAAADTASGVFSMIADDLVKERELQETIFKIANQTGWIVGWTHDARKSEPGEPDLRMVHPLWHRVIFAEIKTMKGKYTKGRWNKRGTRRLPGQDEWGQALSDCPGVEYYLWRPSDLEEIHRVLGETGVKN